MATQPIHKTLLGFLYECSYDPEMNTLFHQKTSELMAAYNLSDDEQAVLNQLNVIPRAGSAQKLPLIKQLMSLLADDLASNELSNFW